MFSIGDTVMHPSEGVCTVSDRRSMQFSGGAKREYYVLIPSIEKGSSIVYLPVERGNSVLRRLLSRADILSLIHQSVQIEFHWIDDSKLRKESFLSLLRSADIASVIRMICEIHTHSEQRIAEGKKPCASDENILAEAQRLLHHEFSFVLKMNPEDTAEFIRKELEKQTAL